MDKREIKFRAWINADKQIRPVIGLFYEPNTMELMDVNVGDNEKIDWRSQSDVILMQYTGLKDKNGKEIYEGDIVVTPGYQNPLSGEIEADLCVVEYRGITLCYVEYYANEGESGKRITPVTDYIGYDCDVDEDCEVIGNIYENIELIEP